MDLGKTILTTPSKANSTTRRIETRCSSFCSLSCCDLKSQFHYKKDWNTSSKPQVKVPAALKSQFHYKKDWNSWTLLQIVLLRSSSKANSTTRRIETLNDKPFSQWHFASKANSTTRRIETARPAKRHRRACNLKSQFHYKKDWNINHFFNVLVSLRSSKANSTTRRIETKHRAQWTDK